MKIYGDPTSNLIRNPVPSSTLDFTSFSEGLPISSFLHQSGTNGAGEDGFVRYTSSAGGTVTGFMGFIYGVGTTAVSKPGDKLIFSVYVRPSVTTSLQLQFEGREALMAVNVGWSMTSTANAFVSCPANVWTRLSVVGTVNTVASGPGYTTPRPFLRGVSGTVYPAGFTYDISSMLLTRGDTLIDYFSGNTAGCSWASGANNSISLKTSNLQFYTPPDVYVSKPAYNELLNPRFNGGTTLAPLWKEYNVSSSTGSFTTTGNNQGVIATNIPAGGSFGVYATDSAGSDLLPLYAPIPSGSNITARVSVSKSGLAAGTSVNMRAEFYGSNGTTLVGTTTWSSNVTTGSQFLSGAVNGITGEAHYAKYYLYISATSNFSGSSSVTFSTAGLIWMFNYGYGVSIAGDGTFTGYTGETNWYGNCSWLGTPDASKSMAVIRFAKEVSNKERLRVNLENQITRPSFANAWITYGTAGSIGTRTYAGNVLTLNATALATGARRYGVSNGRVNAMLDGRVLEANKWRVTMRITVDATGLAPGTSAIFYSDMLNGSTYMGGRQINIPAGTVGDLYLNSPLTTPVTSTETFIWMASTTGSDWTGSTELKVSKAMLTFHREDKNIAYFDGDSPGCSWDGAVGNSRSFMPSWDIR